MPPAPSRACLSSLTSPGKPVLLGVRHALAPFGIGVEAAAQVREDRCERGEEEGVVWKEQVAIMCGRIGAAPSFTQRRQMALGKHVAMLDVLPERTGHSSARG